MIEISHISKRYDNFSLEDISLTIREKEYMVILGPSGAGKTLLLETIAGIHQPDKGEIRLHGKDITGMPPGERHIAVVYQDYMLFPHLTLEQNIGFGLKARKTASSIIEKKINESAEMLGITHLLHRYPLTLSGGEQQRAAIARAIVTEPAVLLLDEPLSAVDEFTTERLHRELKRIHRLTGATTIHITHRFDEAYLLGDRIAVMNNGKIIQVDSPPVIFRKPANLWIAQFVGGKNIFQGHAAIINNVNHVKVGSATIKSSSSLIGEVRLSIRPEDIYISKHTFNEPHLNSLTAVVTGITDRGRFIEAQIDAGIPLITVLSRQSAHKVELSPGKEVIVTFKTDDVHLFTTGHQGALPV